MCLPLPTVETRSSHELQGQKTIRRFVFLFSGNDARSFTTPPVRGGSDSSVMGVDFILPSPGLGFFFLAPSGPLRMACSIRIRAGELIALR